MSTNFTPKGRNSATIKAEKRAAALRENLKRRKEAAKDQKNEKRDQNADPQDSQ